MRTLRHMLVEKKWDQIVYENECVDDILGHLVSEGNRKETTLPIRQRTESGVHIIRWIERS